MQGSGDATALPIYGRIDKIGTAIMVSGDQTDGLQATLSWAVG